MDKDTPSIELLTVTDQVIQEQPTEVKACTTSSRNIQLSNTTNLSQDIHHETTECTETVPILNHESNVTERDSDEPASSLQDLVTEATRITIGEDGEMESELLNSPRLTMDKDTPSIEVLSVTDQVIQEQPTEVKACTTSSRNIQLSNTTNLSQDIHHETTECTETVPILNHESNVTEGDSEEPASPSQDLVTEATSITTEEDGEIESELLNREVCMTCQIRHVVDSFHQLEPGDHISTAARTPFLSCFYEHHAIVYKIENVSDDGKTADLTVIDVTGKGKRSWFAPWSRTYYPVKEHFLYDEEQLQISSSSRAISCSKELGLIKVDYRLRKYSKVETLERALYFIGTRAVKYNLCWQNCEHFVACCVNGSENLNDVKTTLSKSISLQSLTCIPLIYRILLCIVLVVYTYLNSLRPNNFLQIFMTVVCLTAYVAALVVTLCLILKRNMCKACRYTFICNITLCFIAYTLITLILTTTKHLCLSISYVASMIIFAFIEYLLSIFFTKGNLKINAETFTNKW